MLLSFAQQFLSDQFMSIHFLAPSSLGKKNSDVILERHVSKDKSWNSHPKLPSCVFKYSSCNFQFQRSVCANRLFIIISFSGLSSDFMCLKTRPVHHLLLLPLLEFKYSSLVSTRETSCAYKLLSGKKWDEEVLNYRIFGTVNTYFNTAKFIG